MMEDIFNEIRACKKCTEERCLPGYYVDAPNIIFLTQNPGQSHKYSDFDDNILYEDLSEKEFLKLEKIALERCDFGHFLSFLLEDSEYTFDDISRFNVVKSPGFFSLEEMNCRISNCLPHLQRQLWHQMPRKLPVISLGRIAQRALQQLNIDNLFLYHPAYLKRRYGTFRLDKVKEEFEKYVS